MATGIQAWSTTAADNATADASVNWAEGQTPASINNSARAMMAALAAFYDTLGGGTTFGGSANAYTITNPAVGAWSAYAEGLIIGLEANHNNNGAATVNVDGLGAKSIVKGASTALATGDLVSGAFYLLRYDGTNFQLVGAVGAASFQPLDATLTALAALSYTSGTLVLTMTAADTFALVSDALYAHLAGTETFSGTKTFTSAVTVNVSGGTPTAPSAGTTLHLVGTTQNRQTFDAFAASCVFDARRANGSIGSKSATASDDVIFAVQGAGYGATAYNNGARASFRFVASENHTDSVQGMRGQLHSTPRGSTTLAENYRWGDTLSSLELGYRDGGPGSVQTGDYTFALTDRGTPTDHNSGSAHAFTVPPASSVVMPANAIVFGTNWGAGVLTLTRGSGVTFRNEAGTDANVTVNQYQSYYARRHPSSADTWTVRVT